MPGARMEDEPQWKLPKDEPLPAKLAAVKEKPIRWKDKNTGEQKERMLWEWEFDITDGEYAGLKAWGETDGKLTTHPDNKVRQWGETLTGVEYGIGDGINTDDLLGLPCIITVDQTEREKPNGGMFYGNPVVDVFPAGLGQPDF